MASMLSNKYLILGARIVLGLVFIIASIDKIAFPDAFAANIQAYGLTPYPLVNLMALILPWLELICGIFLLTGVLVRSSAAIISALLVIFIVAIVIALVRDLKIDCGCFGKDHLTPIGWDRVLEDIGLLLLGIYLYFFPYPRFSVENLFSPVDEP